MTRFNASFVILALAATISAQAPSLPSGAIQSTLMASGIPSSGFFTSVAGDRLGNVYVITENGDPTATVGIIHQITPSGVVNVGHSTTPFPNIGQLAYNPEDGFVYMVDNLPGQGSLLCRVEPSGGITFLGQTNVLVEGFTFNDTGTMYFGGTGTLGSGIYFATLSSFAFANVAHPGVGQNRILQALPNGDILVGDGNAVHQVTPGVLGSTMVAQVIPTQGTATIRNVVRNPYNFLGDTWLLGARTEFGSTGSAVIREMGPSPTSVATATWTGPGQGFRGFGVGPRRQVYYLTQTAAGTGSLYRLDEIPIFGNLGALQITVSPSNVLTVNISGPPLAPYLAGFAFAFAPPAELFLGPLGFIDLNPSSSLFSVTADGVGVFGPANPLAVLPASGFQSVSTSIPIIGFSIPFFGQALIVGSDSPNRTFFVSNVPLFTIQ